MGTGQAELESRKPERAARCQTVESEEVMRSTTETLIAAMQVLSKEVYCEDGIANSAIAEAAERLEELQNAAQQAVKQYDECDLRDEHVDYLRQAAI